MSQAVIVPALPHAKTPAERRIPVLAAASFATATQSFVFAGLLNEMAADLGVSLATAGQLGTAFALAFALAAPFVAASTARLPRRGLMVTALLLLAALNLLILIVPNFPELFGLRIACGVAAAAVIPAASATAAMLAPPERRGRALAMVLAGTTAAFLLGIPAGSVVGEVFGWRGAFGFAAVVALTAALAIQLLLPVVPGEARGGPGLAVLRRPGIAPTLLLTWAAFAAVFSVAAYIGPAVNRVSHLTGSGVGLMQALVGVASIAGVPVGGWLADRRGMRAAPLLPLGVLAASLLQALLLGGAADSSSFGAPLQAIAILASAGCLFALSPIISARLVAMAPEARAVALAANASAIFLGQASGAALGGLGIALAGLPGMGLMGAAMALLALGIAWRLAR